MPEKTYGLPDDLEKSKAPWYNLSYEAIINNRCQCPEHYRKLIELKRNRPPFELYDMQTDPGQMINLYGLPEYADISKPKSLRDAVACRPRHCVSNPT